MPTVTERNVLSGMHVHDTMRRQVVQLSSDRTLAAAVNHLIRFKSGALLVVDGQGAPAGVVSKTDIMNAFYAGLPVDTALADIMNGPPLFCYPDDELEIALDVMREHHVHRLYVRGADAHTVIGSLAYPDIVGQIYRFCSVCSRAVRRKGDARNEDGLHRARVQDAMIRGVVTFQEGDPVMELIEAISAKSLGAVLVATSEGRPSGVISRTDLVLAYHHGLPSESPAATVMNSPVVSCDRMDWLVHALRRMLSGDIRRVFVHDGSPDRIVGVLSLSDAARFRSGTCKACMPSRIMAA